MAKGYIFKRVLAFLILFCFIASILIAVLSCAPEPAFEELIVCEEIDSKTFAPVAQKDEFDVGVKVIYAVTKVSGVRASDSWRYIWKNIDSGEIISDLTGKYSSKETGYLEGYFSSCIHLREGGYIIAEPGDYRVAFYHNDELKGSAVFKIKVPETKIIEVILANEVSEEMEPARTANQFNHLDVIYACVKLNYLIEGNTLDSKWYFEEDRLINENRYDISENYYEPGYVTFNIFNEDPWPPGNYSVEIYLNKALHGKYDFEVIKAEVVFENIYENDEYMFSMHYPDDWEYEEAEIDDGVRVDFLPPREEINIIISVMLLDEKYSGNQILKLADKISDEASSSNNWKQVDKVEKNKQLGEISYNEVSYKYTDNKEDGWVMTLSFITQNNKLYLFMGLTDAESEDLAEEIYYGMLDTLTFK